MTKELVAALALGWVLAAAPVQAQGTSSPTTTSSTNSSESWTDVGGVTMKGRINNVRLDVDSIWVREVRLAYSDTSSYRIGSVVIRHAPDISPYPYNFTTVETGGKSPRGIRLKKAVLATKIGFNFSNLFEVHGEDVRILVR
ncbi:MAG: hypothetical protein FD129_695 [bacterium]|nr:MAG: hypothetical protein FD129_695 [bacterium]